MFWSPTSFARTARQSPQWDCRPGTNKGCGGTIGLRIRINRLDDASGRCSVSNRPDQPNDSCLFTPLSKTRSMSSAISHPAARSASFERTPSGRGEPLPRHEPGLRPRIFGRPNSVLVTAPVVMLRAETKRQFGALANRCLQVTAERGVATCSSGFLSALTA